MLRRTIASLFAATDTGRRQQRRRPDRSGQQQREEGEERQPTEKGPLDAPAEGAGDAAPGATAMMAPIAGARPMPASLDAFLVSLSGPGLGPRAPEPAARPPTAASADGARDGDPGADASDPDRRDAQLRAIAEQARALQRRQ